MAVRAAWLLVVLGAPFLAAGQLGDTNLHNTSVPVVETVAMVADAVQTVAPLNRTTSEATKPQGDDDESAPSTPGVKRADETEYLDSASTKEPAPTSEEKYMLDAASADAAFQPSNLFSMRLAAGETVYLFDHLTEQQKGWDIRGGFAVAGQDAALASVQVTGPWGSPVWQARHRQSGAWLLTAGVGTYEIELRNPGRSAAVVTVGWVVAESDLAKRGRRTPHLGAGDVVASMSRKITALHAAVDASRALLERQSVRVSRNQQTVDSTQWRVSVYTVAEVVVTMALACVMVATVRRIAASSIAVFDDSRRRSHIVASRRFAPSGMV